MKKEIKVLEFKKKLELNQAKSWGYKSISDAKKNGYNVSRGNSTIEELKLTYKLTRLEAEIVVDTWKFFGLIQISKCCGLDQIIFIN